MQNRPGAPGKTQRVRCGCAKRSPEARRVELRAAQAEPRKIGAFQIVIVEDERRALPACSRRRFRDQLLDVGGVSALRHFCWPPLARLNRVT